MYYRVIGKSDIYHNFTTLLIGLFETDEGSPSMYLDEFLGNFKKFYYLKINGNQVMYFKDFRGISFHF